MNTKIIPFFALLALLASACAPSVAARPLETATPPEVKEEAGAAPVASSESAVLLFAIGMHIEPLGETAQGYPGGKGDYRRQDFFDKHAQDILTLAQIVESHGGRMTIQAQSPFTSAAIESGNTILADLAARGHELALHFHEDAHLGKNSESLSVETWCGAMKQEISLITQASSVADIRYWSGGNLYVDVYGAAACAGLDVNSDWKNPQTQSTDLSIVGVNPWRPAGGTDGSDFTLFAQHDPAGAVVFLPEGQYDKSNFASMRRSENAGGDEAYFEYLKQSLYASLAAAQAGKVNVFHFTVHPGEFRGDPAHPFAVIEKFLAEVVDPLVASGQVQWATFSQMADAFAAWEQANTALPIQPDCPEPMCLTGSFSLLDLQNRSVDNNVLKLFSVAVDSTRNLVYVSGIMTSDIGILNASTETWIGTLEAGFTDRAIKYIHLDPTANYLYILDASNKELRRVDVENGEIVGPIPLADGGFGQLAAVDEVRARFYLATTKGLAAFDGNTLEQLYTVEGLGDHVGPMRYNPAADAFYILDSTSKETGRAIHILDGASGQITGAINYSVPQGGRSRWLHFDPADQTFIIGLDRVVLLLDMNGNEVGAFSLSGKQALEDQLYDPATKRLFVLSMQAPQNGQITAIGGQMDVYDLSGSLLSSFSVGRKPHHMELNPTNSHIYIPNGDASVVWSIDTHAPTQANPLRLGDSVEQIVPSGDGSAVYLASRLGGSYIERYDLNSGSFESFTAGTWPIPLRRDSSGEHLFSLNAWDSTLSVYSMTPQQTLLATIPLGLPAGSTDRLPDLTIDSTHQLAYAAYPEFGMVAVVNWDIMQPVVTLAIPNAETGDTGGGPGQLQVAVNENENRVFVYESRARRLFIYDAANNYASLGEVDLREQSRVIGQADADLFFFDSQTNRLFLGALELDGATAQPTGRSLPAGNQIFGMDSNANLYWVVDEASNALLAMDRDTLAVRHSQPMPESAAALPTLAYNPIRNQVYVGYLTSAQVYIFTIGQIP